MYISETVMKIYLALQKNGTRISFHQQVTTCNRHNVQCCKSVHLISNNKHLLPNLISAADRRGHDRMVVGFTTTYATSSYHHYRYEFESRSGRGILDTT
jgi:hypothetical protein